MKTLILTKLSGNIYRTFNIQKWATLKDISAILLYFTNKEVKFHFLNNLFDINSNNEFVIDLDEEFVLDYFKTNESNLELTIIESFNSITVMMCSKRI